MSAPILSELIESCFRTFEESGVAYGLMRNADEVERGDAHDVDLAIDAAHLSKAEECLFRATEKGGWKLLLRTGSSKDAHNIKCYCFYKLHDKTPVIAHVDFFTSFTWNSYTLLDNDFMMKGIDATTIYHRISPIAEVVDNLFHRLIYNGTLKLKYTPHIKRVFQSHPAEVQACMERFLSTALSEEIYSLVIQEQWEKITALRNRVISDVKRLAARHRLAHWLYILRKAMRPIGIVAVLQGTDGSGKTTIIDALPKTLANIWPEGAIRYFHCRPYVLEPSKQEKQGEHRGACPNPHAKKPYGKLKSFAKLAYCVFDYALGYWGPVYLERVRGHLVVFDRYYYDFYLDKLRYRFNLSDRVLRFMQHFIPGPDVTFVLTGDAEPIWARKKEIPLEEVSRQIQLLEKHRPLFAHPRTINVVQPIEDVVNDVCAAILETQHRHFLRFRSGKQQ